MKKNILSYVLVIILSFLIGFFSSSTYNYFSSTYECKFQTNENIDSLLTKEHLESTILSNKKYNNISLNDLLNNGIYLIQEDDTYNLISKARYYDSFFSSKSQSVVSRAKQFFQDLLKDYHVNYLYQEIINQNNYINPYITSILSCVVLTLTYTLIDLLFFKNKKETSFVYDNQNIYNNCFHISYWKSCKEFLSSPKKIATISMIFALLLISKAIKIPTGFSNLGLTFGFIFFSIIGLLYGPLAGLLIGLLSDILGYFLFDTSNTAFFIGYVFQAMLSGFIQGLFLYKTRITFFKLLFLRITISLVCNVLIGSFCWGYISNYTFQQTLSYMSLYVVPKNLIFLIPQSIVLYLIIKSLAPILQKHKLLDENISKNITLI